jgi:hypothetical protein
MALGNRVSAAVAPDLLNAPSGIGDRSRSPPESRDVAEAVGVEGDVVREAGAGQWMAGR